MEKTHIPTLVGQLLATNNNLQEKAAVTIIEQNRRIAELEAQLLEANKREARDYSELLDERNRVMVMNHRLLNQLAAAAPVAVPQTALQKEIARDAEAFEATLTLKPAREPSQVYPWGWCYVSNEVQNQFKDWCCRHPK